MKRQPSHFPAPRPRRRSHLPGLSDETPRLRVRSLARSAAVLAVITASAGAAADEFHGHLTAGTDYVFRGVSQSNEDPTVYGGLDYSHDSGLFLGLFAAGIDYPVTPFKPDPGDVELDAFIGFSRPAGRDFQWDVSIIRYMFPDSASSNDAYEELAFNLHFRDVARLGLTASDDAATGGETGWVAELELRQPIGGRFQASGTLGRYSLSHSNWLDYWYWDLGVSSELGPVTFDLRYFDTSHEAETFAGRRLTQDRVVASVSVGF
jgi:uncharacterized protein (TIGR02001 family)